MSRSEFSLRALQLRCRAIRKETGQRRDWPTQGDLRFGVAGSAAIARRLDFETTEQCVQYSHGWLWPCCSQGKPCSPQRFPRSGQAGSIAAIANAWTLHLRAAAQNSPAVYSENDGKGVLGSLLRSSVLKCRLDDDPNVHGYSHTVKSQSWTNTPSFCPLPQ